MAEVCHPHKRGQPYHPRPDTSTKTPFLSALSSPNHPPNRHAETALSSNSPPDSADDAEDSAGGKPFRKARNGKSATGCCERVAFAALQHVTIRDQPFTKTAGFVTIQALSTGRPKRRPPSGLVFPGHPNPFSSDFAFKALFAQKSRFSRLFRRVCAFLHNRENAALRHGPSHGGYDPAHTRARFCAFLQRLRAFSHISFHCLSRPTRAHSRGGNGPTATTPGNPAQPNRTGVYHESFRRYPCPPYYRA